MLLGVSSGSLIVKVWCICCIILSLHTNTHAQILTQSHVYWHYPITHTQIHQFFSTSFHVTLYSFNLTFTVYFSRTRTFYYIMSLLLSNSEKNKIIIILLSNFLQTFGTTHQWHNLGLCFCFCEDFWLLSLCYWSAHFLFLLESISVASVF